MFSIFADGPAVTGSISVTNSAVEVKVGASALDERKFVAIQPIDGDIVWSYDPTVTTLTGHPVDEGTLVYVQAGERLPVYVIANTTVDVRISEVA